MVLHFFRLREQPSTTLWCPEGRGEAAVNAGGDVLFEKLRVRLGAKFFQSHDSVMQPYSARPLARIVTSVMESKKIFSSEHIFLLEQ